MDVVPRVVRHLAQPVHEDRLVPVQPSPATFTRTGQVKNPTGPSFGGTTGTTPVKPSEPSVSAISSPNVQPPLAGRTSEAVFTASATVPESPSVTGRLNGAWLRPPATARNAAFQGCAPARWAH